jgi:hypothetical protein
MIWPFTLQTIYSTTVTSAAKRFAPKTPVKPAAHTKIAKYRMI